MLYVPYVYCEVSIRGETAGCIICLALIIKERYMNRTLAILVLLFSSSTVFSSDVPIPSDSDVPLGLEELAENTILDYLSEFSARRRLTTFFTNEQSPFYGAQINFVNVGKGNFTFLNRDLVRVDRMPIVLGRVYDSANNDRTDFGPGWKLTVAEEIRREGNIFRYTDSGNSEFVLTKKSGSLISDYPSLTGIEAGMIEAGMEEGTIHSRWIALRFTSGLTKVFERIGDSYKLVKVSNKNGGGIKLNYESRSLQSITSQNRGQVILHRNRDGLITSATDDHGRSVQFTYDKKGRLAEFTDLGGGEWAYGYDEENNLVSVIDPRGSTILNATYINGKTIEARILHDQMSFEYSKGNTRVSNSLNQEAVFWQHVSGLTEIAKGFGGDTTAIILDTDLKPLSLDYNGSTVADFVYSDARLSQMVRRYNSDSVTEQYTYEKGQLSTVIRDDLVVAAYSYDNQGRLSGAVDDNGTRAYHYHNDGRIKSIISDGELYEVKTSLHGQIEQVGSDDSPWIGINYNPQGTVSRIDRTFSGQNMPLRFEYDERGFRIKANFNESGDVDVTYDSVGGLTSVSYPKDGGRATEEYVVGENNELIEVKAEGKTGVRVEYDSVGRAINITRGSKIFAIQYDQPGRVTSVTLNGSPFLKRSYDTMDVDAVVSSDERTSYITIPLPMVSSIFGSIDEIVYTRR